MIETLFHEVATLTLGPGEGILIAPGGRLTSTTVTPTPAVVSLVDADMVDPLPVLVRVIDSASRIDIGAGSTSHGVLGVASAALAAIPAALSAAPRRGGGRLNAQDGGGGAIVAQGMAGPMAAVCEAGCYVWVYNPDGAGSVTVPLGSIAVLFDRTSPMGYRMPVAPTV